MSGPESAGGGDGVHLEAVAAGGATVNQAGRDLHVHLGRGVRRTVASPGGADVGCPYPGLVPFTAEQAGWFFGRDRLTSALVERLDATITGGGPVMVVAASGAGKSSLLRAGLLPRVAAGALSPAGSRHWPRVVFTPGAHPMRAAAAALLAAAPAGSEASVPPDPDAGDLDGLLASAVAPVGPGARAVLVVDQFEELFRLCEREAERGAFISWLWRAARGETADGPAALAACAVRADFYPDCTRYPELRQALQDSQVIVGAMSPGELREAITCPAEAAGLDIEPGLTELLLADLRADSAAAAAGDGSLAADDGAGRLPLLAHALRVIWLQRHGSTLTVDGYRAAGGIQDAIADSAERVFAGLDDAAQQEARGLFLRLVKIGATSGEDVRRPVSRAVLARSGSDPGAVIDACTAARLLTQSLDTVQITHEALLRAWPRLAGWLDFDRAGQLARQQTEDDAAGWVTAGRDPSLLYRGARLEAAAGWAGSHSSELTATARHFLTASRRLARRTRLIQRGGITVLAVLLLLASVTSVVALTQRSAAVSQSRLAQSEEKTAQSEAMASQAGSLLPDDAPLGMLLSLQAYERAPTVLARSTVMEAAQQPLDELLTVASGSIVYSVAFSPNGRTLAAGGAGVGDIGLWNVATGKLTASLPESGNVFSVAFSPDGRTLAAGDDSGDVGLWDVATRRKIATLSEGNPVFSVAFSPDGRTLAAGDNQGVGLWDVATGRKIATLADIYGVESVAFSPNGRTLAAGDDSDDVGLWNVATGRKTATLTQGNPVVSVAFSPDGRTLAAGDNDGHVSSWDVATGRRTATLTQGNPVVSVAFSPDGRTLAVGDNDGHVGLWNVATGRRAATLAEGSTVESVAFSHDGRTLAAGDSAGDVGLWDVTSAQRAGVTEGSTVESVAFSHDGHTLAAGDSAGDVGLWNMATGQKTATLTAGSTVDSVAFSPDGRTLAAGYGEDVGLWNVATRRKTATLSEGSQVSSVAFSPDGRTLAVGVYNAEVDLWDVATGQQTATLTQIDQVSSVAFSPDGRTLAAGDGEDVALWNVATGRTTATLTDIYGVDSVAFSPDGRTLAAGDDSGDVGLWNVATGRKTATLTQGNPVVSVAFSPSGSALVTGDLFGNVDFWDTGDRQELASLPEGDSGVGGLAFSPAGQVLAIGGANGSIMLLQNTTDLTQQYFTHLICGKIQNNMTTAQWAQYAPGQPYQETCPIAQNTLAPVSSPTGSVLSQSGQRAAAVLASLLEQSTADRESVYTAYDDVFSCGPNLAADQRTFRQAAAGRKQLITALSKLPGRSALPPSMLTDLTAAWQASYQADMDFAAWAADETHGCTPGDAGDPNFQAANGPDGLASVAKQAFISQWNPIATRYGLPNYQSAQI